MNVLLKTIAFTALVCHSIIAQNADDQKKPLTLAKALKLGVEDLTQYTDQSEAETDKSAKADLAAHVKELVEHWTELKEMIHDVNADDARKIVAIAADSLAWLKDEAGR